MSTISTLDDYFVFDCEPEKAKPLQELTVRFRNELLTNPALQNLLLNHGYEWDEGKRPSSFFNIGSSGHLRTQTAIHLEYVQFAIEHATRPYVASVRLPGSVVPVEIELVDDTGRAGTAYLAIPVPEAPRLVSGLHDAGKREAFQTAWMTQAGLSETVRAYERTLQTAFDDFNLQFVLNAIQQACGVRIDDDWPEHILQEDIKRAFTSQAYTALDTAYYTRARGFFSSARPFWLKLNETEHGQFFIVLEDELQTEVGRRVRRAG